MQEAALDFRLLFEGSPDILLVLLADAPRFTMVAATEARLAATHTTREQIIGRGLFEIFPDNPDDPKATGANNLRASLDRVIATRSADTMAVQKYDIRGPDGNFHVKYWSPKNIPLLSADGRIQYILHRVEDVTELVQASELGEVLRDRSRQMERDVINRSRELAEANERLRAANAKLGQLDAAKSAFFSNVSHEFRTPLTLILGPVERALSSPAGAVTGSDLESLHRNSLRLLRLVNSLLDFSRLESGGLSMTFAPTDLAAVTAGLAGAFQSLLDDAGVRLVVDCAPLPEPAYVDATHWEKVVMNLISNAFKFTFEGEIAVRLRSQGDHFELSVRDTGTGIPEHELPRIFERFHRVEGARGRSFEGTGIGLSLVHELVRLHGGSVNVTSELGRGTNFVVTIPTGFSHLPQHRVVSAPAAYAVAPGVAAQLLEAKQWVRSVGDSGLPPEFEGAEPERSSALGPERLLIADDNADMREYLKRLLSPYWHTTLVPDGRAALESALTAPPDLVLSDVMMPEMDGVALLDALRADDRTKTTPVILLSARAGEEARLAGLETGADDYLVKPFSAREVVTRVRTHLEMARVRREAYDALRRTQSQLIQSAKLASLGELVAGVAHEVNNPLAFVISHLDTIQRSLARVQAEVAGRLPEETAAQWERALTRLPQLRGGLTRIQELVLKLRTFARLDEGERKLVSVRQSIDSVLVIVGHRFGTRIAVSIELNAPDRIECFAGLFNQVLMNLVTNAIDAIKDDGAIAIRSELRNGQFELSVADTGCGISESVRARVFDPFFTTKPVGQGTGLGLSIAHSIAVKHGGDIELSAREGGGTLATLRFPLLAVV